MKSTHVEPDNTGVNGTLHLTVELYTFSINANTTVTESAAEKVLANV